MKPVSGSHPHRGEAALWSQRDSALCVWKGDEKDLR